MDGVSKKLKKEQEDEKKKLEEQLKVLSVLLPTTCFVFVFFPLCIYLMCFCFVYLKSQSKLIWGIKDKLKKFCSTNDMKELLIANGQEVPSGESNVSIPN